MDKKGKKINLKTWTTNFYKDYFKNILFYMNSGLSKIRSVHTYVLKGFILVVSTVCQLWVRCFKTSSKLVQSLHSQCTGHRVASLILRSRTLPSTIIFRPFFVEHWIFVAVFKNNCFFFKRTYLLQFWSDFKNFFTSIMGIIYDNSKLLQQ